MRLRFLTVLPFLFAACAGSKEVVIDPAAAERAARGSPCREVPDLGCVYVPSRPEGILVFFRGWWGQYHGAVPAPVRATSARTAFREFGFQTIADRRSLAVLVTGSSDVAIGEKDLRALEDAAGRALPRLLVAAHSGGYKGLHASLQGLRPVARFVMLDDFYFDPGGLTEVVRARVAAGASCTGFVTTHNLERWRARFKPFVDCPVDSFSDPDHTPAVGRCLGAYLDKTSCL